MSISGVVLQSDESFGAALGHDDIGAAPLEHGGESEDVAEVVVDEKELDSIDGDVGLSVGPSAVRPDRRQLRRVGVTSAEGAVDQSGRVGSPAGLSCPTVRPGGRG